MVRDPSTVTGAVSPPVAKRLLLPIAVSLAAAALLAVLIYGVATQSASRTLDQQVASGHYPPAPDSARALPLLGARGRASLASFRGRLLVLNFWASWCEPCRTEAPLLERTQSSLRSSGGTILGVSYLDASSDSEAFVRSYHLTFPQLRDGDGAFARSYGTNQLPESFIIDRAGRVVAVSRGEIDERFLKRALMLARSS
jgi:cytochrome c biogenesis protein CcmG/thiol:disulfide interchange protein DsbE